MSSLQTMFHQQVQLYKNQWIVGSHVKFNGSLYESIKNGITNGMYTIQFFMGNPRSFNRHIASEQDIEKSKKLIKRFPTHVISHFPYVANLAGSKHIAAWDNDDQQDTKTMKILNQNLSKLDEIQNLASATSKITS